MGEKTTTHYSLPYPTGVGQVRKGPLDFQELAEKTDEVIYEGNKVAAGQAYGARTKRELSPKEYEPSATRSVQVTFEGVASEEWQMQVSIGGVEVGKTGGSGHLPKTITLICPAGKKWKVDNIAAGAEIYTTYLSL